MKVRNKKHRGIYENIFYGGGFTLSGGLFYPGLMGKFFKQMNKLPRTMERVAKRAKKAGVKEGRTPLVAVIGQMMVEKVAERAKKKRRK